MTEYLETPKQYTLDEPTSYLRFVERDGKRILQQRWAVKTFDGLSHRQLGVHGQWRDVPLGDETNED